MHFNSSNYIYLARAAREFGDGLLVILLPVYLLDSGFSVFQIGILATLALLGSAAITLAMGMLGTRLDSRVLLLVASAMMFFTGIAYASVDGYGLLLLTAFLGTVNPSAGSASIFVALEQSMLSSFAADFQRTRMMSRYSLVGALAAAAGALGAGSSDALVLFGLSATQAMQMIFLVYSLLGVLAGWFYWQLPRQTPAPGRKPLPALGPSRRVVYRLAALFSVDAFAGGFVVQSLLVLWLFNKFGMSMTSAGGFFFWTGLLTAASYPVAAWLAARFGLINTMVYTHIPSSICLMLAALVPNLGWALFLLSVRAALSQMDVPTRTSYVMAVVTPQERPAAASVTAVPRSLAAALSPALAGAMFAAGHELWPFLICGMAKIVYDLLLLQGFRQHRPPEELGVS